jgi:hypothetical protein
MRPQRTSKWHSMVGDGAALVVYERADAVSNRESCMRPIMQAEPAGCNIELQVSRFGFRVVSCGSAKASTRAMTVHPAAIPEVGNVDRKRFEQESFLPAAR